MTTIAWDGTTLAGDTLVTCSGFRVGYTRKVFKFGKLLVGMTGLTPAAQAFIDWLQNGAHGQPPSMKGNEDTSATVMVVMPDNLIVMFSKYGIDHLTADCYAMGSGENLALGAMLAGCTAYNAVQIAAKLDTSTGGNIHKVTR